MYQPARAIAAMDQPRYPAPRPDRAAVLSASRRPSLSVRHSPRQTNCATDRRACRCSVAGCQRQKSLNRVGESSVYLTGVGCSCGRGRPKPWTPGKPSIANIHCDGLTLLGAADVLVVLLVTGSPLALKFNVKKL